LNSERSIWNLILEQQIDDALSFVEDKIFQEKVRDFEITLWETIEKTTTSLGEMVEQLNKQAGGNRKEFERLLRMKSIKQLLYPVLFQMQGSTKDEYVNLVIAQIKKLTNSPTNLEKAREILGGLQFCEFHSRKELSN